MTTFADIEYRFIDGNMKQTDVDAIDRIAIDNISVDGTILKDNLLGIKEIKINNNDNVVISVVYKQGEKIVSICAMYGDFDFYSFDEFLKFINLQKS